MKALHVECVTLVGYPTRIGVFGNCMSVRLEDDSIAKVVNIGDESLLATKVPAPWDGVRHGSYFEITDERIPVEAFRKHTCKVCGP